MFREYPQRIKRRFASGRVAVGFFDISQRGFIVPEQVLSIQVGNQVAIAHSGTEIVV